MSLKRAILIRGLSLLSVLIIVLFLLVVVLGATGLSDRMLKALVSEELRGLKQTLAQTIKDPEELEKVVLERKARLEEYYGLNQPWYHRLPQMVARVITLDLGSSRSFRSSWGSSKVIDIVLERLPLTVALVTTSVAISGVLGLILGVKIAYKAGSRLDRILSYASITSSSIPTWWLGIVLILVLSYTFKIFPQGGLTSTPPPEDPITKFFDMAYHLTLPLLTLVLVMIGPWLYAVRTMVLNITQEDFVILAKAKGLPDKRVMWSHVVRAAAPAILTSMILGLAGSLSGAILTETVFDLPGMGRLYYDAILAVDEPVIVALTYLFTLIYVIARFALEVLYLALDPRIKY